MEQLKRSGLKHSFWKQFGFQSTNPRTDFRASGLLGLHQLFYFASKHPRELFQASTISNDWFFLALFSIRLTHVIMVLFHLISPEERKTVPPALRSLKCTRHQFKNLLRACTLEQFRSDEALLDLKSPLLALNELHSQSLLYLIELWKVQYSWLTTDNSNANRKSAAAAMTPQNGSINIVELSKLSEKVVDQSTQFLQKVMKNRYESAKEL